MNNYDLRHENIKLALQFGMITLEEAAEMRIENTRERLANENIQ